MKTWQDVASLYQIYPRSFLDTNGDGIGDLNGITEKLDYLSWLGIDSIWISPFFVSPLTDFGYDIANYRAIDPTFGKMHDFQALLKKSHDLDIKVMIDLVPCHTSDQHPWFQESRSSRDNPKRDYYVWRDGKDNSEPNNWRSLSGGSSWEFDEHTGQFSLHSFLKMRSHFTVVVNKCSVIVWLAIKIRIWRVVFEMRIFGNSPNCIDAHSINAHIKPKSHYVFHFSTHGGIVPI